MGFRTPLSNVTTGVNTPRSEFDSSQSQLSSISGSKSNEDSDREVSTCALSKRTLIYEETTPPESVCTSSVYQLKIFQTHIHATFEREVYLSRFIGIVP